MELPTNAIDKLSIEPTGGALGAEIRGIDLSAPVPAETVSALRGAFLAHSLLIFRRQDLDDAAQIRFTSYFGPPERHVRKQPGNRYEEILVVSNVEEDGKPIGALGHDEIDFHSDLAFMPKPGTISILYAEKVSTQGGATQWCSGYAAYDALPASLKADLVGLRATHRHPETSQNPPEQVDHPMVCTHPETGRKTLYVTPLFSRSVIGLDEASGRSLLNTLFQHVRLPRFIWTHHWQPGDLLMWDNRCTMHRREAFPSDQRRLMKRTQVFNNEVPVP